MGVLTLNPHCSREVGGLGTGKTSGARRKIEVRSLRKRGGKIQGSAATPLPCNFNLKKGKIPETLNWEKQRSKNSQMWKVLITEEGTQGVVKGEEKITQRHEST